MSNGFKEDQIVSWFELNADLEQRQYFDLPQLTYGPEQVFVDAGGFDGGSTLNYIKWGKGQYKKIYCLDPGTAALTSCVYTI